MAGVFIRAFRGMRPIVNAKLLENNEAQEAVNVRLFSGAIESSRENETLVALKSAGTVNTIFRARDTATEANNWFEFATDVDVVLSPITQDEYGRIYFTDGIAPKYAPTDVAFAAGAGPYPRNHYLLGIPKPTVKPVATGTAVTEAATSIREYLMTFTNALSNPTKESGASDIVKVKALTTSSDLGIIKTTSFTASGGTLYQVLCEHPHQLVAKDFIGISGSSVAGWNNTWEVDSVVNEKTFKIKNTQAFPASVPSGNFTVKKRYKPKVKLFELQTDNLGNTNITHKRIYRKVSGTFRLLTTLPLATSEYEDVAEDSSLSGNTAITNAVLNRPVRPKLAPSAIVPFDDTTIADDPAATVVTRLYAIAFKNSAGIEGPLSKYSGIVSVINGTTKVRVTHVEKVDDDVINKRIYRIDITYSSGTYSAGFNESNMRLVAEVPASQDTYIDETPQSSIASNATPTNPEALDAPQKPFGAVATLVPTVISESRVYVYTYVSEYGEEGPPSDPSDLIDINPFESVSITSGTGPSGQYNITKKYIYRTSSGSSATDYQFVGEQPLATTPFIDFKKQVNLGEIISSINWEPPPANMKGLRMMANGIMVGFSGKDVCFSEPYLPHAWSSLNRLTLDHTIIGVGAFGQSVALLTNSYPYIATGADPSAMSLVKTSLQQACVSKRSIVETGDAVIYASPDGLVKIGVGGIQVLTLGLLSQAQWQEYNPSSIHAYLHEGRYYGFYTKADSTSGLMVLTLAGPDAAFSLVSQTTTAAHVVAKEDSLFIVESGNIRKMDKASTLKTYKWVSKIVENPTPLNFGFAQVISPSFGAGIIFKVYADGSLRHTATVTSSSPIRLPSGFIARDWYVSVEGTAPVTLIALAQSAQELKQI